MQGALFTSLLNNATLLLSLALLHSVILLRLPVGSRTRNLVSGLLFGLATVLGMTLSVHLLPGVVFDGRSIVLSMAGLFSGPLAAAIAVIIALVYRAYLGGVGAGVGMAVIATTGLLGTLGYLLRRSGRLSLGVGSLFAIGVVVHLCVLAWMLALPAQIRWQVLSAISLPMMLIFPLATVFFGMLLLMVEQSIASLLALRETQFHLLEAEANSHLGHWWLQAGTLEAHWADEIYRILGIDRERPAGLETLRQVVHPEDWPRVERSVMSGLDGEMAHDLRYRIRRPDGETRWVDCRGKALRDEHDRVSRLVGTLQDVTDRVASETQAREQEARLRKAQTIGHIGSWEYDPASGRIWASDEGFRIFGMSRPASGDLPIEQIEVRIPDRARVHQALVDLIESDQPYDLEFAIEPLSGGPRRIVASKAELIRGASDLPLKVAGVVQDITERKRAEYALRDAHATLDRQVKERTAELAAANRHLQELDRLKSLFVASMSHELRTPLNSIIGFTGMMLQQIPGPINAKQRDYLERVASSGRHLLALIGDVIDIAKIEAGQAQAYVERFDLGAVINESVDQVRAEAEKRGISLHVDLPEPLQMVSDRRRLMQCLLNYLSNALKYTSQGLVSVRAVRSRETAQVEISVQDTGIGIAADEQRRLFQPFSRIDSEITRRTAGTGLGLYLTRKLVIDVLGGRVSMESRAGEGSTFRLHLPQEIAA